MRFGDNTPLPTYIDGCFRIFDIVDRRDENNPDFPIKCIKERDIGPVWFRQMSIFDRTRITFEQADIQLTMKIRIPRWDGISPMCVCLIDDKQLKVYNTTPVISKQGYPETEITLVNPPTEYEVTTSD